MTAHAVHDGPFFLGCEPSLAEALTVPTVFRIAVALPALVQVELLPFCAARRLGRLAMWLSEVMARPSDCCELEDLPAELFERRADGGVRCCAGRRPEADSAEVSSDFEPCGSWDEEGDASAFDAAAEQYTFRSAAGATAACT